MREPLKLSQRGLDLIRDFEGYHRQRPDGGCTAYQTILGRKPDGTAILDIPTIGWGCTKGVTPGMIWTREQAETALAAELSLHERAVNEFVTVPLSQGQFDALVSFDFNTGSLLGSTLLKRLEAGDTAGAAAQFDRWTRAGGQVQRGLVRRRAAEKAMFLSDEPMAQAVDRPADTPAGSRKQAIANGQSGALVAGGSGIAGVKIAHDAGVLPDLLKIVVQFAADNAALLALGGIAAGLIVSECIKKLQQQDVADGRYTPSGDA